MRTEFVSTVSHELRTPLAAIYGAAMTLRRSDVSLDDEQRTRLLDIVSGEADRLARTVNDILWASRLDTDTLSVDDPELRSARASSTRLSRRRRCISTGRIGCSSTRRSRCRSSRATPTRSAGC